MESGKLTSIAESLLENVKKLESSPGGPETKALRQAISNSATAILRNASDPMDHLKSDFVKMAEMAAINIFMEWKVFDHIPDTGSISCKELAAGVGAEESLIDRLSAMLVANGSLIQLTPGHVQHSRISRLLKSQSVPAAVTWVAFAKGMKPYMGWPEYFEKYGRGEPQGQAHTPSSFAWGQPELPIWDIIAQNPEHKKTFATAMKAQTIKATEVVGSDALYTLNWVEERAKAASSGDRPLLVDVGGGHGQLLKEILAELPAIPHERCVLQDRKEVVEEALTLDNPVMKGVVHMGHDFHQEQPVKGALVYVLRRILLDWPDQVCVGILSNLAKALPADDPEARVLIIEPVKMRPPTPWNANVDMVMLNIGGKLRNEESLTPLVQAAGLRVVKVYYREGDEGHVIECAKA